MELLQEHSERKDNFDDELETSVKKSISSSNYIK